MLFSWKINIYDDITALDKCCMVLLNFFINALQLISIIVSIINLNVSLCYFKTMK